MDVGSHQHPSRSRGSGIHRHLDPRLQDQLDRRLARLRTRQRPRRSGVQTRLHVRRMLRMTPTEGGRLRVVMLAKGWTGYLDAAFAELARLDVDLTVARPEAMKNTAFDLEQPNGIDFITI